MRVGMGRARPKRWHRTLDYLCRQDTVFRYYSQNVDRIESQLLHLEQKTRRTHDDIFKLRCQACQIVSDVLPGTPRDRLLQCTACRDKDLARIECGLRSRGTGVFRTDMVLYDEPVARETGILEQCGADMKAGPDCLLVVGARLRAIGAQKLVRGFMSALTPRGISVWVNHADDPPKGFKFDYNVKITADDFAEHIWDSWIR